MESIVPRAPATAADLELEADHLERAMEHEQSDTRKAAVKAIVDAKRAQAARIRMESVRERADAFAAEPTTKVER
jgi:hypothetical protein